MVRFEIAGCGVLVTGPLEGVAAYYKEELLSRGYKRKPLANHLRLLGHLSKWMQIQGLEPASLTLAQIEAFLGERRLSHTELFSRRGLGPLLDWLAGQDAIPFTAAVPPSVSDPAELVKFQAYLRGERRLAESTIAASMARARRFWEGYVPATGIGMLTAAAVTKALLDEGLVRRPVSVKAFGYTLRSLLRFAFINGFTDHDLSGSTLVVRHTQPSRLPVGVSREVVTALLESCPRATSIGLRDHAILLLLSRLGLRASEVARLRLEDIDWHGGELLVRGKGNCEERLPLLHEVGKAIAVYLHDARPEQVPFRGVC